ncbi:ester cyclase [Chitinophagaceae bacterium LB-8]|uniref:Ester cyclase n=1 Tax=Paraflavisolibacter caeni TaxID=2982496 RepID=A0A9X2XXF0_9BACT|nr:ester cyclase [Paraflavisolibacter caeni]MCU7550452.1 ester cyclase [Paraflavisolibacter caeni]
MKRIFLLIPVACLFFAACNNPQTTASNEKMDTAGENKEERNKKIALESVDGINAHNIDMALKNVTPDAVDYGDGSMDAIKGIDSIKASVSSWLNAFPDVKGENLKSVADGDLVMVWGDWSGTWKNDFMGQKATDKSYKIKDVDIFRFNDEGKITEHHFVQSPLTSMVQVGMKMPEK